jgi:hypothetical protein
MYHVKTVDDLRNIGYKVRVRHYRNLDKFNNILPRGGKTVVSITDEHGHTVEGLSRCSSEDGFNKKIGVAIAIGRALKNEESYVNR